MMLEDEYICTFGHMIKCLETTGTQLQLSILVTAIKSSPCQLQKNYQLD